MVERRQFLKQLIGAAVAMKLPIGLEEGAPQIMGLDLSSEVSKTAIGVYSPYGSSFYVTREMLEDEMYAQMLEIIGHGPGGLYLNDEGDPVNVLETLPESDTYLVRLRREYDEDYDYDWSKEELGLEGDDE